VQGFLIVAEKFLPRPIGLITTTPQVNETIHPEANRRIYRIPIDVLASPLHEFIGLIGTLHPGQDRQVGESLGHFSHQFHINLPLPNRRNKDLGMIGTRCLEDIESRCIAKEGLKAHLSQNVNAIGVIIKDRRLHPVGAEESTDGAAKGAKTGDNYRVRLNGDVCPGGDSLSCSNRGTMNRSVT